MKKQLKRSLALRAETIRVLTGSLAHVVGGVRPAPTEAPPCVTGVCTQVRCDSSDCQTQVYQGCTATSYYTCASSIC